jgi:hypothetical protein
MNEYCKINISRLKSKLAEFHVKSKEDNVRVVEFEAGGHKYSLKLNFEVINWDVKKFSSAKIW